MKKKLICLLVPAGLLLAAACSDAPETSEEKAPVGETVKAERTEPGEQEPAEPEAEKHAFPDVTPDMMVAFKRFREAVLNKDAVRLQSMITVALKNGCATDEETSYDAAWAINLLDDAQLEVLKKRVETTVNTDTESGGCIYKDHFMVDDDKQGFSWSVGCIQLLEEEIGEYATNFAFRKVNGKYKLVGVMCAG